MCMVVSESVREPPRVDVWQRQGRGEQPYDLGAAQRLRPVSPGLNDVSVIELHRAEGSGGARRDLVTPV